MVALLEVLGGRPAEVTGKCIECGKPGQHMIPDWEEGGWVPICDACL